MQSHYEMNDPTQIANLFFVVILMQSLFCSASKAVFSRGLFFTLDDDCEDCRETNLNDATKCVCICKGAVSVSVSVKYLQTKLNLIKITKPSINQNSKSKAAEVPMA